MDIAPTQTWRRTHGKRESGEAPMLPHDGMIFQMPNNSTRICEYMRMCKEMTQPLLRCALYLFVIFPFQTHTRTRIHIHIHVFKSLTAPRFLWPNYLEIVCEMQTFSFRKWLHRTHRTLGWGRVVLVIYIYFLVLMGGQLS